MKWSEGLRNMMCIIIRRYTVHMKFAASLMFFWFNLYIAYMVVCSLCFCLIL